MPDLLRRSGPCEFVRLEPRKRETGRSETHARDKLTKMECEKFKVAISCPECPSEPLVHRRGRWFKTQPNGEGRREFYYLRSSI